MMDAPVWLIFLTVVYVMGMVWNLMYYDGPRD